MLHSYKFKRTLRVANEWLSLIRINILTCMAAVIGIVVVGSGLSRAATISIVDKPSGELPVIKVDGEINFSDVKRFQEIALTLPDALVALKSPGGHLEAGIEVGRTVRLKGFSTAVSEGECSSACSLIWLAGKKRTLGKSAAVGVHSASAIENGKVVPDSAGNALVGAYLGSLGVSDEVVEFFTSAPPEEMKWLSLGVAQQLGLDVSVADDDPKREAARELFDQAVKLDANEDDKTSAAVKLYWHSAQAGFAGAQNNLGDLYERGSRVQPNDAFAVYWYARAAERGEPTAYLSLSTILSEGNPDNAQLVEALKFAILAATELPGEQNRRRAEEAKRALEKRLSEGSRDLALELAGKWRPLFHEKNIMGDP